MNDLRQTSADVCPDTLDAAVQVGRKIGWNARRGRRQGALLVLGDCPRVLLDSRQLVPNPFFGHSHRVRWLTDPALHEMIVELSKLDGAFVVRGDGFIVTAATFLTPGAAVYDLPAGLGARHVLAAAVSARTRAAVVAVSATDGHVRLFIDGALIHDDAPRLIQDNGDSEPTSPALCSIH